MTVRSAGLSVILLDDLKEQQLLDLFFALNIEEALREQSRKVSYRALPLTTSIPNFEELH